MKYNNKFHMKSFFTTNHGGNNNSKGAKKRRLDRDVGGEGGTGGVGAADCAVSEHMTMR